MFVDEVTGKVFIDHVDVVEPALVLLGESLNLFFVSLDAVAPVFLKAEEEDCGVVCVDGLA